jgi:hypothetical protein
LAGLSYYSLTTTKIEPPAVTRATDATSDQRLRRIYASSGGNQLLDSVLYDSSLKTECTPTILQDGAIRCMPVSPLNYSVYYSDSACTQRLNLIVVPNSPAAGCTLPPLPLTATITSFVTTPTCTVTRDVRPLSTPYTGTLYGRNFLGQCLLEALTGRTAYLLGDPMPLESFPSATLSTDM